MVINTHIESILYLLFFFQKVNANVKKSDQDLVQLKANLDDIFDTATTLAPGLKMGQTRGVSSSTAVELKD